MKSTLRLESGMRLVGENENGNLTYFDTSAGHGEGGSAATPMEIVLQSVAGCTAMDVLSILRKKRKDVQGLTISLDSERSEEHPKVFTKIHLHYVLKSPDASVADLNRAIELSQASYCSVSIMLKRGGVEMTYSAEVQND